MGVTNGELANETTLNSSFMDREQDTDTTGRVDLLNVLPASGASVNNVQRNINALASALGIPTDQVFNYVIAWDSAVVGSASSSAVDKIEAIVLKFKDTFLNGGHTHDGTDGEGPQVDASDLASFNNYWTFGSKVTVPNATGTSFVVTTIFAAKTPGGTTTSAGVLTDAPDNRVQVFSNATQTFIEDSQGQRVYGRLTYAASVWTLSFYTNEAGVETAHNLSLQDIFIIYREVYTSGTRPTFGLDPFDFSSLDLTADVVDASLTVRGLVSTGTQSFAGAKTFSGAVTLQSTLSVGDDATFAESIATQKEDVATSATITALSSDKSFVRFTGATVTEVQGIAAGTDGQRLTVHNASSAVITFKHQNGGASASDRIITPSGGDTTCAANASINFIYDSSQTRWVVTSFGSAALTTPITIANGGTGQTTQTAAFDALAPTTTKGDLIVYDGTDNVRQAVGTNDYVVTANSSATNGLEWRAIPTGSYPCLNLGLATSVASNALTISLKQADGSTDPSTGSGQVKIPFRNATATSGGWNMRSVSSSLTLVISSGSTLGTKNATVHRIHVYAIDNSGTVELSASQRIFDDGSIVSTTAEGGAGAADSNRVLYSETARSNVPSRLIGVITISETTAGTWATNATQIDVQPFPLVFPKGQFQVATGTINSSFNTINFTTIAVDNRNSYSSGVYTIPEDGEYCIEAAAVISATWNSATPDVFILSVFVNGARSYDHDLKPITATGQAMGNNIAVGPISLAAGDTVEIKTLSNATTPSYTANAFDGFFNIAKVCR